MTADTSEVPVEFSSTRAIAGSVSVAFFGVSSFRSEKRALSTGLDISETTGASTRDERVAIS